MGINMNEQTGIERISNILQRKPVDRIGLFEHFWSDTQRVWTEQGHIQPDENLADLEHAFPDLLLMDSQRLDWNFTC